MNSTKKYILDYSVFEPMLFEEKGTNSIEYFNSNSESKNQPFKTLRINEIGLIISEKSLRGKWYAGPTEEDVLKQSNDEVLDKHFIKIFRYDQQMKLESIELKDFEKDESLTRTVFSYTNKKISRIEIIETKTNRINQNIEFQYNHNNNLVVKSITNKSIGKTINTAKIEFEYDDNQNIRSKFHEQKYISGNNPIVLKSFETFKYNLNDQIIESISETKFEGKSSRSLFSFKYLNTNTELLTSIGNFGKNKYKSIYEFEYNNRNQLISNSVFAKDQPKQRIKFIRK